MRIDHIEGTYTDFSRDLKNRPNFMITNNNLASELDDNTLEKSVMNMTDGQ